MCMCRVIQLRNGIFCTLKGEKICFYLLCGPQSVRVSLILVFIASAQWDQDQLCSYCSATFLGCATTCCCWNWIKTVRTTRKHSNADQNQTGSQLCQTTPHHSRERQAELHWGHNGKNEQSCRDPTDTLLPVACGQNNKSRALQSTLTAVPESWCT